MCMKPLRWLLMLTFVWIFSTLVINRVFGEARYMCTKDGEVRRFYLNVTRPPSTTRLIEYHGTNASNQQPCLFLYKQSLMVDVHPGKTLPCGVVVNDSGGYTLTLSSVSTGGIIIYNVDFIYKISCKFAGGQTLSTGVTVGSYNLPPDRITLFKEDAWISVHDKGGTTYTSAVIGSEVFVRVNLKLANLPGSATGVQVTKVTITDTVENNPNRLDFIDEKGCSQFIPAVLEGGLGFTKSSVTKPGHFISASPPFRVFMFASSSPKLSVRINYEFCYSGHNSKCDKTCASGRRKRELPEPSSHTGSDVLLLTIRLPGDRHDTTQHVVGQPKSKSTTPPTSQSYHHIIISILALSFTFAAIVCIILLIHIRKITSNAKSEIK